MAQASNGYFYLFRWAPLAAIPPSPCLTDGLPHVSSSFDICCRSTDSTYNIRVNRADNVLGPYADKDGVPAIEVGLLVMCTRIGLDSFASTGRRHHRSLDARLDHRSWRFVSYLVSLSLRL